jgi:lysophospholipase L1-like esterase
MARWHISLLVTGGLLVLLTLSGCSPRGGAGIPPTTAPAAVRPIEKGDEYVAIGDSYTVAPAADQWTDACLRTNRNYPHLVAEKLGLRLKDVSCGGAATTDVTAAQTTGATRIAPQAAALSRGTDLVTISLGANDFNAFRTVAVGCAALRFRDPAGAPCERADVAAKGRSLENTIAATERRLVDVIDHVAKRAPSARIMVIGYPEFFPENGPCAQFPLALGDYRFAHRFNELLVRAQERSAARTHVEYVDVFTASRGHNMCAQDPWIAGVRPASTDAMPLHPYPEEQQLVARLVLKQLS